LGSDDTLYEDEASEYILSVREVADVLPGTWEQVGTRPPETEPVGHESSEIRQFSSSGEELELGVMVMKSRDDAKTWMEDNRAQLSEQARVDQDVGDEAFSVSIQDETILYVRAANIYAQLYSTLHVSQLRELASEQINHVSE
jgi:hypothetical protein